MNDTKEETNERQIRKETTKIRIIMRRKEF
jgi:hypothetical protein